MIKLNVRPFEKEELVTGLKKAFPQYKIQSRMGAFQVRTKSFTITGNVGLKVKPKKGEITVSTNYDMRFVFLLFFTIVGIYIIIKKDKQLAMEKEVAEKVKEILS